MEVTGVRKFFAEQQAGTEPRFIYPIYDPKGAVLPIYTPLAFLALPPEILGGHGTRKRREKRITRLT